MKYTRTNIWASLLFLSIELYFLQSKGEVFDDNYFIENLPRFDNPIYVANEQKQMEEKVGWKLENIYDENNILHRNVKTPYDHVPSFASTKYRKTLATVANEPLKRALLRETVTKDGNSDPLESIDEMKELLELKILSETSSLSIKSSMYKRDKTNQIVNGQGLFSDIKGTLLSKLWLQLGNVHRSVGNIDKAILCLKKSFHLDPNNEIASSSMGAMLRSRGRAVDALLIFKVAYKRNPKSYLFNHHLGEVLRKLGRKNEAINFYKTANEINPLKLQTVSILLTEQ